jgi:hypothetical protein
VQVMVVGLPLEFVDREGIADFFGKKVRAQLTKLP